MRAFRFVRPLLVAALVAGSAVALAQTHSKHAATLSSAPAAAAPAVFAYLSAKQALTGLHAPCTKPIPRDDAGRPMLSLRSINRSESLTIRAASDDGGFAATDLDRVGHLLRAMSGDEHPIDPRTLGLVYRVETHFEVPEVLVVSGYRVPRPGSHSNHGKGRAIDIVVPGIADEDVARFVRDIGFVGVGVYPVSQFVHVDIRPRSYFWVDYSGPHSHNREHAILGDLAVKSDAAAIARGQAPIEPYTMLTDVDRALKARGLTASSHSALDDEDEEDN